MGIDSIQFDGLFSWPIFAGVAVLMVIAYRLVHHSTAALLVRLLALGLLLLALANPSFIYERSEHSKKILLVDVSDSMTVNEIEQSLAQAKQYVTDELPVSRFGERADSGRSSFVLDSSSAVKSLAAELKNAAANNSRTNLESGLRAVGADAAQEILLVSDGNENIGHALSAVEVLRSYGNRVFPIIPESRAIPAEIRLTRISAPLISNAGDAIELRTTVKNSFPSAQSGSLEIFLEKEKIHSQPVTVKPGSETLVIFKTPPLKSGAREFTARFIPKDKANSDSSIKRWVSVKERSKVILISSSNEDSRIMSQILKARGYPFDEHILSDGKPVESNFENTAAVILTNVPKAKLSGAFLSALKSYVNSGGGLIISGGDKSFGLGGYMGSVLEELSPLKSVPPQTEKKRLTNAIVLVIDKSGSMLENGKMESTKRAAMTAVSALKDEDFMGIVAFDSNPFVILDVKPVKQARLEMERRLLNLTPVGQTNLLPGMAFARIQLQRAPGSRKHLIVLSDGKIPLTDSSYVNEINNLRKDGITVSTVALGGDADVPFMKLLAQYGKGVFYHVNDPSQLPKIFVEDIKVSTGEKTIKEQESFPVAQTVFGSRVINLAPYPSLKGFVETVKKEGAELELEIRSAETAYPLQASWRSGQGAVIGFASDASGRWSSPWISWESFTKFWTTSIERVKAANLKSDAGIDFDLNSSVEGDTLKLDLAIFDPELSRKPVSTVSAVVGLPSGQNANVVFNASAPGRFIAEIKDASPGNYRAEVRYKETKFPPIIFTVSSELFGERQGEPINLALLSELAQLTSGKINPTVEDLASRKISLKENFRLAPYLLSLALVLIIIEALIRERRKD